MQKDPVLPNYIIDALPIFQPYFDRAGVKPSQISGQNLELIVSSWLGEIIYGQRPTMIMDKSQQWLIDSGLYDALHGGNINKAIAEHLYRNQLYSRIGISTGTMGNYFYLLS